MSQALGAGIFLTGLIWGTVHGMEGVGGLGLITKISFLEVEGLGSGRE